MITQCFVSVIIIGTIGTAAYMSKNGQSTSVNQSEAGDNEGLHAIDLQQPQNNNHYIHQPRIQVHLMDQDHQENQGNGSMSVNNPQDSPSKTKKTTITCCIPIWFK